MTASIQLQHPERPVYFWILLTGLYLFGFFLLWYFGFLELMVTNDRTFLSSIIVTVFFCISAYVGFAAWRLASLGRELNGLIVNGASTEEFDKAGWLTEHIRISAAQRTNEPVTEQAMHQRLVERIYRGHDLGWFAADALIRLGLIGTVIGFILMLGAVYQLKDEDVTVLQDLLGSMGVGMQVALYTTLAGISCSLAIAVYCKLLDRFSDALVSHVVLYLATGRAETAQ